jgi:DNA recombination protein Rad52
MGFSAKQTQALRRNLDHRYVRTREAHGRELSYIEGWYAISEANRIFGFDGWSRETIDAKCVLAREVRGAFTAVYVTKVRISVQADGTTVVRDGHGSGQGHGSSPGEVHDIALKAAETDATKRALATFGRPFGLALYGGGKSSSNQKIRKSEPTPNIQESQKTIVLSDETTSIPPPSRDDGRRQYPVIPKRAQEKRSLGGETGPNSSIVPDVPEMSPGKIDKSALTISEPRRLRDKAHLRFVASHSCLVCQRQPSDPHHLRFAQPRALGLKVSDEFTVPLCRDHHRQLHQAGNEVAWWHNLNIKPLPIAKRLWSKSHLAFETGDTKEDIENLAEDNGLSGVATRN